jgi:DNA polymerase-3 subunit epsilon
MYLFFDTETTGIPRNYKAPASDLTNWPRIVQLAWLTTAADGHEIGCAEHLIKPDGFEIPNDAAKIHGITTKIANETGTELNIVLARIEKDLMNVNTIVAHNMQFDEKVLGAEFLRTGRPNIVTTKAKICTMQLSTEFCQLPGPYGYKWPTLQELHLKLFNISFQGAHRALSDVRACAACYFELKRRGIEA